MTDQLEPEEPPPFLSRWRNVYILLVAELAFLTIVFRLLAGWASS